MMSFALPTGTACAAAPVMQAVKRVEGDRERERYLNFLSDSGADVVIGTLSPTAD